MKKAAGGVLIALMLGLTLLSDFSQQRVPLWFAGVFGWLAVACLIADVKKAQRWQTGILIAIGLALLIGSASLNHPLAWKPAIGNNVGLVAMLASVGFLRLIALPQKVDGSQSLPVGFAAFVKTMLGVSLFGSIINISASILFADRLQQHNALNRLASQSITRVFSGCSVWSPFFGGMAAVLTYVPDMRLGFVALACLPFAVIGFLVVILEVRLRYAEPVKNFKGYPVNFFSLWIPAALASMILVLSRLAPQWSVLTLISTSALTLTAMVLVARHGLAHAASVLVRFVFEGLPAMINELQLFLAAGVLAAGLGSLVNDVSLPIVTEFGLPEAIVLVGGMILLAVAGVHPIVTISGATPLLMTLQPQHDILAVCYLLAWSLGTCASPLSGTHLVFQGRYGIPSWKGAFWNWPYVGVMYFFAVVLLVLVAGYFNTSQVL